MNRTVTIPKGTKLYRNHTGAYGFHYAHPEVYTTVTEDLTVETLYYIGNKEYTAVKASKELFPEYKDTVLWVKKGDL